MQDRISKVSAKLANSIYELIVIEISNQTGLKRRKVRSVIDGKSKSVDDIYEVARAIGVSLGKDKASKPDSRSTIGSRTA